MQHNPPNLASFTMGQVYGEHFFVTGADQNVRVVVERMRDEACPIAVLTENGKIVGVIEGGTVLHHVVGQPAQWTRPSSSLAQSAPVVEEKTSLEVLNKHLSDKATTLVVVTNDAGVAVKVITRASWLKFLNFSINTSIFQPSPHLEAALRHAAIVS